MDVDMYDPVCREDPEDHIENEELSDNLPPCKECEKHFFYRKSTFNCFDGLFVLISMGTFLADVVTDTLVTVQYFKTEPDAHYAWGSLTLAFTLGPSIVMQIFSASWYVADEDMTKWRWIMHLLQLAPLQRYIRVFKTGLTARESDDPLDYQRLHHQQSDVSMLRLFEAFLESAPQVVLQLYVMVATDDANIFTGVSAMVSLFSLCWAMVAYSKNHRKVRNDKNIVSIPGLILQTIWRIGMISSRVVALVLFASIFQAKLFIVAAVHWFCMTIWAYVQNTDFCDTWVEERIFNAVIGVIYLFCFFNLKEGNSRYRVTLFYTIMFGENAILLMLWYLYREGESWYDPVAFSVVFGGFAIGVSSMLLYYRFFHPRGSGAILLFKKKTGEDRHRLHPKDHAPRPRLSEGAEISRRSRSPTPVKKQSPHCSPHKQRGNSPLAYPITRSRSLTPCKYSPLKSDCELPYDRYGMRRRSPQNRSQSEACIDRFSNDAVITPRLGRVHSDTSYSQQKRSPQNRSQSEACIDRFSNDAVITPPRLGRVHSETSYSQQKRSPQNRSQSEACIDRFSKDAVIMITPPRLGHVDSMKLYSQQKTPTSTAGDFEFSGFATNLVKQFDKKMDHACASAMGNYSYGSYGFDVEAQTNRSHNEHSSTKSEHQVMVHAASSQPDMRRLLTTVDETDQSSVLLEPLPNVLEDTPSKIKNAYEVQQMYNTKMNDGRLQPSSKRQLSFGQSDRSKSSIQQRLPTPMCPYHQRASARRSNSLPSPRRQTPRKLNTSNSMSLPRQQQNAWQVCEIDITEPKNNLQKVQNEIGLSRTPPKVEPQSVPSPEKLKIPQDTSKVERQMLKSGEKRKFSFREKVPEASLKAMRFTPKPAGDPSSPIWKLRALNARLWQPKTVDIYNPKLNNSPGKPMVVAQKRFGPQPKLANGPIQAQPSFTFNSEDSPDFGNYYTIFGPPTRLKNVNSEIKSSQPAPCISNVPPTPPAICVSNVPPTPHNSLGSSSYTRPSTNDSRTSFEFGVLQNQLSTSSIRKKSPLNNSSGRKSENIYATIDEDEAEDTKYSELGPYTSMYLLNPCTYGSGGSGEGSGGKKRKLSPRADLPQQDLKTSQQSSHPVTPLTPSKSYRLADQNLQNSPHRHISSSSSNRSKSRLNFAQNQKSMVDTPTQFEQIKDTPQVAAIEKKINSKLSTNKEELNSNSRTTNVTSDQMKCLPTKTSKQSQQLNSEPTSKEKDTSSSKVPETIKTGPSVSKMSERNEKDPLRSDSTERNWRCPTQQLTTDRILPTTSASDGKNSKKSLTEKHSPRSNSLPAINDPQTCKTSATQAKSNSESRSDMNSKDTKPRNDKSSSTKPTSLLEKQSGKSQSLPEIATTEENSQVKKDMKPKAHSDNRENFKQPSTSSSRKPLGQIQNGSILASSSSYKPSNNKLNLLDKSLIIRKLTKLSPPIESALPLMQSTPAPTPALPDCRKLLRFESTGAKPKSRQLKTELTKDSGSHGRTKTKKPLSPVENGTDEHKSMSVTENPIKTRTDEIRITQPGPSIMESRLRDRIGRYDPDISRSGKENQHHAIARFFDVLSPTDSFVSSLAFQNTIDKRGPPKKPPRTSIGKIPNNTVPENVSKFSNGTDL